MCDTIFNSSQSRKVNDKTLNMDIVIEFQIIADTISARSNLLNFFLCQHQHVHTWWQFVVDDAPGVAAVKIHFALLMAQYKFVNYFAVQVNDAKESSITFKFYSQKKKKRSRTPTCKQSWHWWSSQVPHVAIIYFSNCFGEHWGEASIYRAV